VPSGENPWTQLLASNRRRSKGDLGKLQVKLWHAIDIVEHGMHDAMEQGETGELRHWIHCLNQLSLTYAKIVIDCDLEQRIKALEGRVIGNA
jgi:hypothetical protein